MTCIFTAFLCLEMHFFLSNANFVITDIRLKNSKIVVELPKIELAHIHRAGGLGDLQRLLRYELRKRLYREFIV